MSTTNAINLLNTTFGDKTITTNTGPLVITNGINAQGGGISTIAYLLIGTTLNMNGTPVTNADSYNLNTTEGLDFLKIMGSASGASGSGANGLWVTNTIDTGNVYDTHFNPVPLQSFIPYPTGSSDPISFGKAYLATDPNDIGETEFAMPTTGVEVGQVLQISGSGASTWSLNISSGQAIFMDDIFISDSGKLTALTNRASVTLVCTAFSPGNQLFSVINSFGVLDLT